MLRNQKARIISFIGVAIILFFCVAGYAQEIKESGQLIEYTDDVTVDGSDFTGIVNLFTAGTNGMIAGVIMIATCISMFFISIFIMLAWRLIAIRKSSVIHEKEEKISKIVFGCFVVVSLVAGTILAGASNVIYVAFLVLFPTIFLYLFGVKAFGTQRNNDIDE